MEVVVRRRGESRDVVFTKQIPPENVKIAVDISGDLPQIYVDPRQMGQVLDNTGANAYQTMPDGGKLKI